MKLFKSGDQPDMRGALLVLRQVFDEIGFKIELLF